MFYFKLDEDSELRILEKRHANDLFQLTDSCRPYLRPWLPWVDSTKSPIDTAGFIEGTQKQFGANNGFQAGIWHKGKMVGVIGLHFIDWSNRKTSIGYWLGEGYQGRGLMTKSVSALIDHAIRDLGLKRVEIRCAIGNKKSRAIPERLGLKEEGVLRNNEYLYDHFVDHVVYACTDEDWLKK